MKHPLTAAPYCALILRKKALALCLTLCTLLGLGVSASAQGSHITTFDVPGAGTGSGQGTFVSAINPLGVITGNYVDSNDVSHGYIRSPKGSFTTFDAPGRGSSGIIVHGINLQGAVVGSYLDANNEFHGFRRSPDGTFSTFEAPGACRGGFSAGCNGTGAYDINIFGVIVGAYEDTSGNFVAHGYIRNPDGKFTTFAVPGSSMEAGQGTLPAAGSGLNQLGAITGIYYDANNTFHGFLRSPNGTFTTFEAPGADTTTSFGGTFPQSLNDFGAIAGYDLDTNGVFQGFVRGRDGKFTVFDAPDADTTAGDFNGTFPTSINLFGIIAGISTDANGVNHGFIRDPNGKFTTFDAPGADLAAGDFNGTFPMSNNLEGTTTGYSIDSANVFHGFVRRP